MHSNNFTVHVEYSKKHWLQEHKVYSPANKLIKYPITFWTIANQDHELKLDVHKCAALRVDAFSNEQSNLSN